jgi:Periplasmic binding protein
VLGRVRVPLNNNDFSSFLLQAQASRAKVIGLANAGDDTINSVKQAGEFGIVRGGQSLAGLLVFTADVAALGLQGAGAGCNRGRLATAAPTVTSGAVAGCKMTSHTPDEYPLVLYPERQSWLVGVLDVTRSIEAARVHHASRRRGGWVAARGAGAAGRPDAMRRRVTKRCYFGPQNAKQRKGHEHERHLLRCFLW